jgi:hypothetical protein
MRARRVGVSFIHLHACAAFLRRYKSRGGGPTAARIRRCCLLKKAEWSRKGPFAVYFRGFAKPLMSARINLAASSRAKKARTDKICAVCKTALNFCVAIKASVADLRPLASVGAAF